MKRDLDLVRLILVMGEAAPGPLRGGEIEAEGYSREAVTFHVRMMEAHGLLTANVTRVTGHADAVTITGLTWDGFDYLDAIRSPRIWDKAKGAIAESVGDVPLSVVKSVCTSLALSMVKAQLGI